MTVSSDTTLEVLAGEWLAAERAAVAEENAGTTEARARAAAEAYESAVRAASPEELLLAWHAARQRQLHRPERLRRKAKTSPTRGL